MPDDTTPSFSKLPDDLRRATALVQAQFKESVDATDKRVVELGTEQTRRKNTAITLKVISVLSGLIIATGFITGGVAQILGGCIPGIAALERIFANMSRLLAVSAAKNAYERVRRAIVARHSKHIVEVIKIQNSEPKRAADLFIKIVGELRDDLARKRDQIETDLSKNDYDNLGRLNLEENDAQSS